jgi:hypothetical protein
MRKDLDGGQIVNARHRVSTSVAAAKVGVRL